jgi:hypothetical protein
MFTLSESNEARKTPDSSQRERTMSAQNMLKAIVSGAVFAALISGTADASATRWQLPRCLKDQQPVSLQIITEPNARWKVNGASAQPQSSGAWVNIPPSTWIGPRHPHDITYTYMVPFFAPGPHGPMTVSATWAADNCGVSLQGGTGTAVPTGACYEGDKDFVFAHTTTASFSSADQTTPNLSITFVATNLSLITGMTGVFTVTAECP